MKTIQGKLIVRLPMEAVLMLRGKGGAHTTEKGKKGYNRNADKARMRKEG